MPQIMAVAVIRIARTRPVAPVRVAASTSWFSMPCLLGKAHQKNGVCHRDADRHNRSHEALNIERGPGQKEHENNAAEHAWNRRQDSQWETQRLKVCHEQQKDGGDREQQTGPQSGDGFFQCWNLATHHDCGTLRGSGNILSAASICFCALPNAIPCRFAVTLTMRCPLSRSMVSGIVPYCSLATWSSCGCDCAITHHRQRRERGQSLDTVWGELYLDLKGVAGPRIAPVVGSNEARGTGRRYKRSASHPPSSVRIGRRSPDPPLHPQSGKTETERSRYPARNPAYATAASTFAR